MYKFYHAELWLEIYKEWDRSEDDKWIIFKLWNILIEYLYRKDAQLLSGTYLYIEKENIVEFYGESSVEDKTELVDTAWWHRQFLVFDPEGFEIKFFKDSNK